MKWFTLPVSGKGVPPSNRGVTTLGCLFFLIFIGLLGYVGFMAGSVYWNFMESRQKIREALNWAVAVPAKSDFDILQKVIANVRTTGIELSDRNIKIIHQKENLTISASWERQLKFPYYTYPWRFTVNLTEVKRWRRGGLIIK